MSELYVKLANARDNNIVSERNKMFVNDVYTKLLSIAFTNDKDPDKLPNRFILAHVFLNPEELNELFKSLDIGVTGIKVCNYSCNYGYYYEVFIWISILYKGDKLWVDIYMTD